MGKGVHRVTSDSKAGCRMAQAKGARVVPFGCAVGGVEVQTWNAEVERRKAEKKAVTQARRDEAAAEIPPFI